MDVNDEVVEQIRVVGFLSQLCDQLRGGFCSCSGARSGRSMDGEQARD